jgi:general secretion pathway protein G
MKKTLRYHLDRLRRLAAARGSRRQQAGMTLLEIMIVLAIIALVAGSIGVGVFSQFKKAQVKTAKEGARAVAEAAKRYMLDNSGACPPSIDDLVAQRELPKKPKDPWGQDFTLKCPGQGDPDGVDVMSNGPDRQEGTADDVKSW